MRPPLERPEATGFAQKQEREKIGKHVNGRSEPNKIGKTNVSSDQISNGNKFANINVLNIINGMACVCVFVCANSV